MGVLPQPALGVAAPPSPELPLASVVPVDEESLEGLESFAVASATPLSAPLEPPDPELEPTPELVLPPDPLPELLLDPLLEPEPEELLEVEVPPELELALPEDDPLPELEREPELDALPELDPLPDGDPDPEPELEPELDDPDPPELEAAPSPAIGVVVESLPHAPMIMATPPSKPARTEERHTEPLIRWLCIMFAMFYWRTIFAYCERPLTLGRSHHISRYRATRTSTFK
jgi:hypothetical protein